jgi:DNA polymerase eta
MIELDGMMQSNQSIDWTLLSDSTHMLLDRKDSHGTSDDPNDLLLFNACKISLEIRTKIMNELGYTCSTGIAHNKLLAKLISSSNKPAKQTVLLSSQILDYMKQVPICKMRGFGGTKGLNITQVFGVELCSDLWTFSPQDLVARLGVDEGRVAYDACRGICQEKVSSTLLTKSIQSCKNFRSGLRDWLGLEARTFSLVP